MKPRHVAVASDAGRDFKAVAAALHRRREAEVREVADVGEACLEEIDRIGFAEHLILCFRREVGALVCFHFVALDPEGRVGVLDGLVVEAVPGEAAREFEPARGREWIRADEQGLIDEDAEPSILDDIVVLGIEPGDGAAIEQRDVADGAAVVKPPAPVHVDGLPADVLKRAVGLCDDRQVLIAQHVAEEEADAAGHPTAVDPPDGDAHRRRGDVVEAELRAIILLVNGLACAMTVRF